MVHFYILNVSELHKRKLLLKEVQCAWLLDEVCSSNYDMVMILSLLTSFSSQLLFASLRVIRRKFIKIYGFLFFYLQTIGAAFCRKDLYIQGRNLSLAIWVRLWTWNEIFKVHSEPIFGYKLHPQLHVTLEYTYIE